MRTTIKFYRVVSLLLVLFCVAAASLTACGLGTTDLGATIIAEKEVGEGAKTITFTAVDGDKQATVFTVHTDAEFLRDALDPHGIIVAEGTWVTTVNGITADSGKQEWWMLYEGTQPSNYGVDELRIKDGGEYTFVLTVGW
jgi:hypothetical protein